MLFALESKPPILILNQFLDKIMYMIHVFSLQNNSLRKIV